MVVGLKFMVSRSGICPAAAEKGANMIPIALQLYSIRDDCAKDLPGTLKAVADMGYDGVEFAGYHGATASELKTMVDDLGLKVCGTHTGIDTLMGDELEKIIEFHRTIGNKFLIVPGLPEECRDSIDAWRSTADVFNEIAELLKPHDMLTGYHNHTVEFQEMDGQIPWDVFFGNTSAEVVMQVDTGNAWHGGADPIPYLERYPGRAITVHLKEYDESYNSALIGDGKVPWDVVFGICESTGGTEWYIVEQETYAYPPLECVDRCLKNLRGMGK